MYLNNEYEIDVINFTLPYFAQLKKALGYQKNYYKIRE